MVEASESLWGVHKGVVPLKDWLSLVASEVLEGTDRVWLRKSRHLLEI
jgi:hypothetical protein